MRQIEDPAAEQERVEGRASASMMRLLTGTLTAEGDTFLIGVGAVILCGGLYPAVGAWALLAFPAVLIGAAAIKLRR
jgi:hypothetical protein